LKDVDELDQSIVDSFKSEMGEKAPKLSRVYEAHDSFLHT